MASINIAISMAVCITVGGCAHLEFPDKDGGLAYFEPVPHMFVTTSAECVTTGTVVMVPGERKIVKFKQGYGSSDLSVTMTNGMIASVGQKADIKTPETLTAVGAFTTALAATAVKEEKPKCKPSAILYPIRNGAVDMSGGTPFPVSP
jgi:hypothetical protein